MEELVQSHHNCSKKQERFLPLAFALIQVTSFKNESKMFMFQYEKESVLQSLQGTWPEIQSLQRCFWKHYSV